MENLLFVIRDQRKTPLEYLKTALSKDVEKVDFINLSSYEFEEGKFKKQDDIVPTTYVEKLQARIHEKEEENRILKKCIQGIEGRLDKIKNAFIQQTTVTAPTTNKE